MSCQVLLQPLLPFLWQTGRQALVSQWEAATHRGILQFLLGHMEGRSPVPTGFRSSATARTVAAVLWSVAVDVLHLSLCAVGAAVGMPQSLGELPAPRLRC